MALSSEAWRSIARTVLASRRIDEIEERELAPKGLVTYQFSAKGHELIQALVAEQLVHPHDAATVYYRSRPFVLHAGMTYQEAFSGPLARSGSRNGGRDIGVVHNLVPRRNVTVLPASGDVGAQYTPAAGWAQAIRYYVQVLGESKWEGAVAVALGGDGSVATNGFWSALTVATTLKLPLVMVIEDNGFGISVRSELQTPGGNIANNLRSFRNLVVLDCDGADPAAAAETVEEAIRTARTKGKPVLLRARVPRLCGHSGADNQSYKTAEERTDEEERDPLPRLRNFLQRAGSLSAQQWKELAESVEHEVRSACEAALAEPEPDPSSVTRYVFFDGSTIQQVGGQWAVEPPRQTFTLKPSVEGHRVNFIEAVRRTLASELERNRRVLVFGEDVGIKGGVHGATMDLQRQFGSDRVFDTSLSEEGIIGRSVGMALAGLVPVPEIQFRKYLDPAMEQFNDCGTIRWRTNNQFAAPIIVRIPVGYSKRTGDPWHSVSGEAIFAHTIGWIVAFPSNARDAAGLLRSSLYANDPVVFLEHRNLLDTAPARTPYPGDDFIVPFGEAYRVLEGTAATIVTWGDMVYQSLEAVRQLRVSIEVIDLRTIRPWDKEMVLESVAKTGRCLIVHEDTITCGFGAEISATITEEAFSLLDAPVMRLAPPDVPIPYNKALMAAVVPTAERIAGAIEQLLSY
ncbi:MAG: thiamine pyrophosphate-dependent enzyme [Chlorobi bacterium]|nr:thiamine pyrophosphate-dependent enzyme [Chlorobiota bacterium]